jgi:hypothetical protein
MGFTVSRLDIVSGSDRQSFRLEVLYRFSHRSALEQMNRYASGLEHLLGLGANPTRDDRPSFGADDELRGSNPGAAGRINGWIFDRFELHGLRVDE